MKEKERRMNRIGRRAGVLAVLLCMALLTACGKTKKEEKASPGDLVFSLGSEKVYLPEVYIYAEIVREHYSNAYGEGVWSLSVDNGENGQASLEELTREDIIDSIVRVKLLNLEAEERAVALTQEEEAEVSSEAARFWKYMTDEEMEKSGVTEDLVNRVMRENILAKKMYDKILQDAALQVSDEEARETKFYDLVFPLAHVAEDGTVTPVSDEEAGKIHERALAAYDSLLNPTNEASSVYEADMERLKKEYQLTLSEEVVMTPEEIQKTYGSQICDMLYSLDDGSYSLVTESQYGYHIFYMIALTDREATDARKEVILRQKRQEYFEQEKNALLERYAPEFRYDNSVNMDVYSKIKFE